MAAGSTQRQFDPGISSKDESVVSCTNMLKKAKVIELFIGRLMVLRRDRVNQKILITE